jgi:8-amino-7-oxononanoate synthase
VVAHRTKITRGQVGSSPPVPEARKLRVCPLSILALPRLCPMSETAKAPVDVFAKAREHDRLEQLEAAKEHDLLPYFRLLTSQAGPVVEMEGRETIMLGSNNYLGLTGDPRVKEAAREALETYGTGVTGSRLLNGTTPLHLDLERELAEWMGTDDAIVFTTGYQANVGAIGTILGPADTVICDSGDHASILDGVRISGAKLRPFRHNRTDKLEKMLGRAAEDGGGVLVIVDGVFSMEGDVPDLPRIVELCRAYGARLMVDEAHGAGVLGARGAGAAELFGLEDEVDLRMGTFSKSLASCGGFIVGQADVIEYLRVSSRAFIFSASAVPAAVGAALAALRVIRSEGPDLFERLLANASYLREGLRSLGLRVIEPGTLPDGTVATTPVVPVVVGEDWQAVLLWKALFDAGVYTNVAIHPAVPPSGALLRTSLMATHTRENLDTALATIERVIEDFPDLPRL